MRYCLLILVAAWAFCPGAEAALLDFGCHQPCPPKCSPRVICCPECKTVKEEKQCWQTECETICVPPVTLPCCGCLFSGRCCGSGCECRSSCSCGDAGCPICSRQSACCKNSLLRKVFGKFCCCQARCVKKLKPHKYECEKTEVEWKVVCPDSCNCCDSCSTGDCCPAADAQ